MSAEASGKRVYFHWGDDFVGISPLQQSDVNLDGEAVFVGHGISAPEFKWDDFKGVDVSGKILVLFTNEPPSDNPKFFDGPALTYYGRWTYKYEEALRRGSRPATRRSRFRDGSARRRATGCSASRTTRWKSCSPRRKSPASVPSISACASMRIFLPRSGSLSAAMWPRSFPAATPSSKTKP